MAEAILAIKKKTDSSYEKPLNVAVTKEDEELFAKYQKMHKVGLVPMLL
jgi:hypothetical protein